MKALVGLKVVLFSFALSFGIQSGAQTGNRKPHPTAIFAGGCFWCVEADFEKLNGVKSAVSGYTGGTTKGPTYKQVSAGGTGHTEAIEVTYDAETISYQKLVEFFWQHIDPTNSAGQFCDTGSQYRPEIFVNSPEQRKLAEESKAKLENDPKWKGKIKVAITEASVFFAAEEEHQDYYKKNPIRYNYYRRGCGRDQRIKELWGH